ncbi:hypothetical protein [uncultured Veillonella sp.]|uniref:hypothetical protein n=1 Tax=uncultured Veillonella sp. TaxID=159268 RepID=UPI0028ECC163|nr:hypothetical protein [uncultured Veillonella sp.]
MKFLVALIVLLSCAFSSNAFYNNPNGSYAYDIGYNSGYIHGSSGHWAESNYGRNYDYIEGYNDGYYDGQSEYYNRQNTIDEYNQSLYY